MNSLTQTISPLDRMKAMAVAELAARRSIDGVKYKPGGVPADRGNRVVTNAREKDAQKIIDYLRDNPRKSRAEITDAIGFSVNRFKEAIAYAHRKAKITSRPGNGQGGPYLYKVEGE